jgi:hypothetical protein
MIHENRQYMTLKLRDELFAIDVAQVREVLEVPQIADAPHRLGNDFRAATVKERFTQLIVTFEQKEPK